MSSKLDLWKIDGDVMRCSAHGTTFPIGGAGCEQCNVGDFIPPPVDETPQFEELRDDEKWLRNYSVELRRLAKEADGARDTAQLAAAAVRARRSAVEIRKWIEDWERTLRLEKTVKELEG